MSFFAERGILHAEDSKLKLDAGAVAAALPASVQGVLNARSAALKDRTLQVASVIGRGFKPDLLAVVLNETDIDERLAAMRRLYLIRLDEKSSNYTFKRTLVRDALYQSTPSRGSPSIRSSRSTRS